MKALSTKFHLAVGLTSVVVSLLLLASFVGLVPDRDAAVRAGRTTLAESVAISTSVLLGDDDDRRLEQVLRFVVKRNPELLSIAVRERSGRVLLQVGAPVAGDEPPQAASTDTLVRVPLLQEGLPWGQAELRFVPVHGSGWWNAMGATASLVGSVALGSFALFYLYLRRMLRHLDPSRVIPKRVRTAFDTLAEGLLVLDQAGRIVLANRAFADVVGGDADALLGRRVADLAWSFGPDDEGQAHDWPALVDAGQPRRNVLMYLADRDGKQRSFMINLSPVPGAGGRPAGMLVSLDDVTALQEQEIALRIARDAAEAANRAKSDFLANMSHEIRTPMNAILGFAELLRRGWQQDSRDAHRHLDTILGSGRHLLALINDILDLSKVEAGRLEVERTPCAIHEVVQDVATVLRVRAEEKGLTLAVEFPQALPVSVLSDAARVRQILTNLVGNALKFTSQGQVTMRVSLRLEESPVRLAIDVMDTGIGIAADRLEAIFDPFVQAEASTTRQYGGTGLGLAISRRFARALGGDVTVTSVPGQGSAFHVTLDPGPLDDVAWLSPEVLATVHRRPPEAIATRWKFDPHRVLVVDDAPENRELVRLVLESSGLKVLEAENGLVGLEMVEREQPALVLMDVQMPVMDGFTAARKLRERGFDRPVIALTANAMKGFERELEQAGFTGHLTKPVDIDGLLAALALRLGGEPVQDVGAAASLPTAPPTAPRPAALPAEAAEPIVSRLANHPRLGRVVRTFGTTLSVKLQAMREALAAQRLDDLAQLAHWLKGAGGTVGFDVFFEPARDFEADVKAGRLAELEPGLRRIEDLAARIVIPAEPAAAAAH